MRPVVLGLNNPHSADPKDALGVEPVGSAGHRLWLMVKDAANRASRDFTEEDYLESFDRRNLMNAHFYNHDIAVKRRSKVLHELQRKVVVTCGTGVLRALGLKHTGFHLEAQAGGQLHLLRDTAPFGADSRVQQRGDEAEGRGPDAKTIGRN